MGSIFYGRLIGPWILDVDVQWTVLLNGGYFRHPCSMTRVRYRRDIRWARAWAFWQIRNTPGDLRRMKKIEDLIDWEDDAPCRAVRESIVRAEERERARCHAIANAYNTVAQVRRFIREQKKHGNTRRTHCSRSPGAAVRSGRRPDAT